MCFITRYVALIVVALFLCGCVNLPLNNDAIDDPALLKISKAYEKTIQSARNDPEKEWQSGWLGNMWVHFSDSKQSGLCYEWKYLVHNGVANTVKEVGWQTRGIVVNEKQKHEHHAVVVFDPKRANPDKLLDASPQSPVYVLDAWRQGKADIYTMRDWLESNFVTTTPARIFIIKQKLSYNWAPWEKYSSR